MTTPVTLKNDLQTSLDYSVVLDTAQAHQTKDTNFNTPYCQKDVFTKQNIKRTIEGFGNECSKAGYKIKGYIPATMANELYTRYKQNLEQYKPAKYLTEQERSKIVETDVAQLSTNDKADIFVNGLITCGGSAIIGGLALSCATLLGLSVGPIGWGIMAGVAVGTGIFFATLRRNQLVEKSNR